MKITPILDRVILKEIKTKEKKTKSGIILPSSVKETPCEGKIVAINADYKDENGNISELKKGDLVLYPSFSAMEFFYDDQTLYVIKISDILCKIEKED